MALVTKPKEYAQALDDLARAGRPGEVPAGAANKEGMRAFETFAYALKANPGAVKDAMNAAGFERTGTAALAGLDWVKGYRELLNGPAGDVPYFWTKRSVMKTLDGMEARLKRLGRNVLSGDLKPLVREMDAVKAQLAKEGEAGGRRLDAKAAAANWAYKVSSFVSDVGDRLGTITQGIRDPFGTMIDLAPLAQFGTGYLALRYAETKVKMQKIQAVSEEGGVSVAAGAESAEKAADGIERIKKGMA
jgi:hypothetical protein